MLLVSETSVKMFDTMYCYYFRVNAYCRILLVEQHVEGDDDSALQWLLRADVERSSLLEDEARISAFLHGASDDPLPDDLKGVNLEVALNEVGL